MVVYHVIRGKTGRFTVWVNSTQNSRLVNFGVPESRVPFAQIGSIHRKTASYESLKLVSKMALMFG